jgi:hypothetical protein
VFYGCVIGLILFVMGFFLFSVRPTHRPLFDALMPMTVVTVAAICAVLYFRNDEHGFTSRAENPAPAD